MVSVDYSLLQVTSVKPDELNRLPAWDLFISAFNKAARVEEVFDRIAATEKHWLIHPEFEFTGADIPDAPSVFSPVSFDEAEFWRSYVEQSGLAGCHDRRVCVDATGFLRPHLIHSLLLFRRLGFQAVDILYSEPQAYEAGDRTQFGVGPVVEVRQVRGFEGIHSDQPSSRDLLVIGVGYDDEQIRRVASSKRAARKAQVFGLPSLQAHMYHESRLRAALAEEEVGTLAASAELFAPANNPFETAQVLQHYVDNIAPEFANLYLSPLATKAQALGFAFFLLCEWNNRPGSLIAPIQTKYSSSASVGLSRTWLYRFELDWIPESPLTTPA